MTSEFDTKQERIHTLLEKLDAAFIAATKPESTLGNRFLEAVQTYENVGFPEKCDDRQKPYSLGHPYIARLSSSWSTFWLSKYSSAISLADLQWCK